MVDYYVENHLCFITMNCPERRNALGETMLIELAEAWTKFCDDDDAWLAILTGAGKVFSSGADKSFFARALEGEEFNNMFLGLVNKNPLMTGNVYKPTIMAINGPAIGGGAYLALRGDFRICSEDAFILFPESALGNVLLFWEDIPAPIAKEMVCGFPIDAKRGYEVGLFNRVVSKDKVLETAIEFANQLLEKPPLTIRRNIEIMNDLFKMHAPMQRKVLMDYCAQVSNALAVTEDSKNAMTAFLDKSKPVFKAK